MCPFAVACRLSAQYAPTAAAVAAASDARHTVRVWVSRSFRERPNLAKRDRPRSTSTVVCVLGGDRPGQLKPRAEAGVSGRSRDQHPPHSQTSIAFAVVHCRSTRTISSLNRGRSRRSGQCSASVSVSTIDEFTHSLERGGLSTKTPETSRREVGSRARRARLAADPHSAHGAFGACKEGVCVGVLC